MRDLQSAVVVLDQLRSDGGSHEDHPAAADKLLGSAGGHGAQENDAQRESLDWPPTRCRWPGCAGGSGMMLELLMLPSATMSAASMMSMPTSELLVCRHPCTRALTGNAHIRLLRIACQVVLHTQRLWR